MIWDAAEGKGEGRMQEMEMGRHHHGHCHVSIVLLHILIPCHISSSPDVCPIPIMSLCHVSSPLSLPVVSLSSCTIFVSLSPSSPLSYPQCSVCIGCVFLITWSSSSCPHGPCHVLVSIPVASPLHVLSLSHHSRHWVWVLVLIDTLPHCVMLSLEL
jgi:hypothetical protein